MLCELLGSQWHTLPSERIAVHAELQKRGTVCIRGVALYPSVKPPEPRKPPGTAPNPGAQAKKGSGSGFIFGKRGDIITNHHVIDGCDKLDVLLDNVRYPATLRRVDPPNDLAVISAMTLPVENHAAFRKARLRVGEDVIVVGFPIGPVLGDTVKATTGIISASTGLGNDVTTFQFTAPIQPGNSGGPIFDKHGRIAGVASGKLSDRWVAQNTGQLAQLINIGIKSDTVLLFLNANGIDAPTTETTPMLDVVSVVERAEKYTVRVLCNF